MKKLLAIALSILLVGLFSLSAFAAQPPSSDIDPLVYTPCSGGNGICQLKSSGHGSIYNTTNNVMALEWACCWQCKNCGNIMVTEGDPLLGEPIGIYATYSSIDPAHSNLTIISVPATSIKYTSKTSIEGYKFRLG